MKTLGELGRAFPWLPQLCYRGTLTIEGTNVLTGRKDKNDGAVSAMGAQRGEVHDLTVASPKDIYPQIMDLVERMRGESENIVDTIFYLNADGEKIGDSWLESSDDGFSGFVTDYPKAWQGRSDWEEHIAFVVMEVEVSPERCDELFILIYRIIIA
ncbi:MAG: hypothetical protein V1685_07655 [Parcubacteria group bacterium]